MTHPSSSKSGRTKVLNLAFIFMIGFMSPSYAKDKWENQIFVLNNTCSNKVHTVSDECWYVIRNTPSESKNGDEKLLHYCRSELSRYSDAIEKCHSDAVKTVEDKIRSSVKKEMCHD